MNTIKKLSSNGFFLESGWKTVDLNLIKSKTFKYPFENLEVGDKIDNIKYKVGKDKKEYVTDFMVINHDDIGVKEDNTTPKLSTTINNSLNSSPSPINIQDSVRYSQSVNLAFNSTSLNGFESEDKWISFTFDRADKIYLEFNKRCSK
jgi:hypothetical protein